MVKLTKIYTRGGDKGETSLVDGSRLKKHDIRIEAYGTIDEANAAIGLIRQALGTGESAEEADAMLMRIQNDMFDLGADLATPGDDFEPSEMVLRIIEAQVVRLEHEIDAMNEGLKPLTSFILPGGTPAASFAHLARTIVRRAERLTVAAADVTPINPAAIRYLNRLSDHLFVLGRVLNGNGHNDVLWVPGAHR